MKRREFIIKSGIGAGALLSTGWLIKQQLLAAPISKETPRLTVASGGTAVRLIEKVLQSTGYLEAIIRKGAKVLIKPTIAWDRTPEMAANTNPELVGKLIEACYKAGARQVLVVEHTVHPWTKCYKNSGIERVTKDNRAKILPGNEELYYVDVQIPQAQKLKKLKVHEALGKTDVLINVPVLKADPATGISGAIKNLTGLVWDRHFYYLNDFDRCAAEFLYFRKPDLNIVDASRVLMRHTPAGESPTDVEPKNTLIVSTDIVAADACAARLLGLDPDQIGHIKLTGQLGFGAVHIPEREIKQLSL
jgi:uncharacterized protein (DUF362 family)